MTKHITDHERSSQGSRVRHHAEVERRSGPEGSHPAAMALNRRGRERDEGRRMQEFLRIERGGTE